MARVANRRQQTVQNLSQEPVGKVFQTAIYTRLSREDNLSDSDSIENQIEMLRQYIDTHDDLRLADIYVDNGYTGTDFERPGWQKMMDDVRLNKIECILVKDLSRLGRNYIETGEFLEKICPFFGLRFIAMFDGFDTNNLQVTDQLSVALSNIINDYYAKDISRKVSSALRSKMENGEYIGSWEKYGYLKSPENKNKLIVNPETAPIVKMIFEWRSDGMSYMGINKRLNDMGIPSPSQYKADRGIVTNSNQSKRKILWNKHIVTDILQDITYLGHLAQRKTAQSLYAGIPVGHPQPYDWIVVENTHESIIEQSLFDKVQEINRAAVAKCKANSGKYDYIPKVKNIYGKKFTCADCGAIIKQIRSYNTQKTKAYHTYKCPTFAEHGSRACNGKRLSKEQLDEAVLASIKAQFDLFLDTQQTMKYLLALKKEKFKKEHSKQDVAALRKKLEQKKALFAGLYRDLREGLLNEQEYTQTRDVIKGEISRLEALLEETESTKTDYLEHSDSVQMWSTLVEKYYDATEISEEMVDAMIASIQMNADSSLSIQFNHMDAFKEILNTIDALRKEVA